jgi:NADH dehydrogenase
MKVLVTGATGFVGRGVVEELHRAGHTIHLILRDVNSGSARAIERGFSAQAHAGNVLDVTSMEQACEGLDAVIHLVGIISQVGQNTFENVHTRGTQNVVAAAQKAGLKRFIHMSALGTRPNAVSNYHNTKWAAEEAVRQSGLAYTIFRPSLIYGPQDQFVNRFTKIIRLSPVLPVLGSERTRFQPVALEAVAVAFMKSLAEPNAIGQTYDLCGPEAFTLPQILDQILAVTGRKRWKLRVPAGIARYQAAFLEFLFPLVLRKAPPFNRDQLIMLMEDNVGNAQPANELFGLKHASFREGIARYLSA